MEPSFQEHTHKPEYDVCVVCLLQPSAVSAVLSEPSPQRAVGLQKGVDTKRAADTQGAADTKGAVGVTAKAVTPSEPYARWIAPPQDTDSEFHDIVVPNGISEPSAPESGKKSFTARIFSWFKRETKQRRST